MWRYGALKKGCGLYAGLSGNAYCLLMSYQLTKDTIYLRRAEQFLRLLESDQYARYMAEADFPFSLFEGVGGAACYAADMATPEGIASGSLPFFEV